MVSKPAESSGSQPSGPHDPDATRPEGAAADDEVTLKEAEVAAARRDAEAESLRVEMEAILRLREAELELARKEAELEFLRRQAELDAERRNLERELERRKAESESVRSTAAAPEARQSSRSTRTRTPYATSGRETSDVETSLTATANRAADELTRLAGVVADVAASEVVAGVGFMSAIADSLMSRSPLSPSRTTTSTVRGSSAYPSASTFAASGRRLTQHARDLTRDTTLTMTDLVNRTLDVEDRMLDQLEDTFRNRR